MAETEVCRIVVPGHGSGAGDSAIICAAPEAIAEGPDLFTGRKQDR